MISNYKFWQMDKEIEKGKYDAQKLLAEHVLNETIAIHGHLSWPGTIPLAYYFAVCYRLGRLHGSMAANKKTPQTAKEAGE